MKMSGVHPSQILEASSNGMPNSLAQASSASTTKTLEYNYRSSVLIGTQNVRSPVGRRTLGKARTNNSIARRTRNAESSCECLHVRGQSQLFFSILVDDNAKSI